MANDFHLRGVDGRPMPDKDELRLLYVAMTRAQHALDISALLDERSGFLVSCTGPSRHNR
ncbi:hypothetical protein [Paraburkholderia kirstenboschensis]|uniref:hypothetical protein n=1 Tax=Paraburkholderia kirstenboschensis TaxID=1245436 RepID=UPI001F2313A0|nr:hypothetical protein [Paraburkholderia kirstenboschensis]